MVTDNFHNVRLINNLGQEGGHENSVILGENAIGRGFGGSTGHLNLIKAA